MALHENETTENDAGRCPYVNDYFRDPPTRMREDGWRCGMAVGHSNMHTLYSADGERVLDQIGPWRVLSLSSSEVES